MPGLHSHCFLDFRGTGLEMLQTASDASLKEWSSICTGEQSCDAHASHAAISCHCRDCRKDGNGMNPTDAIQMPTRAATLVNKSHWPIFDLQWKIKCWTQWHTPLTPALETQRQVDLCWVWGQPGVYSEFRDSQGYVETISQKNIFLKILYVYVVCEHRPQHIPGSRGDFLELALFLHRMDPEIKLRPLSSRCL